MILESFTDYLNKYKDVGCDRWLFSYNPNDGTQYSYNYLYAMSEEHAIDLGIEICNIFGMKFIGVKKDV